MKKIVFLFTLICSLFTQAQVYLQRPMYTYGYISGTRDLNKADIANLEKTSYGYIVSNYMAVNPQYAVQGISDGKGLTYSSPIPIQSNMLYRNYVLTGNGSFVIAGQSITNVTFVNITIKNSNTIAIDINSWVTPSGRSSNILVDSCTTDGFAGGTQYFFSFHNCDAVTVQHCSFVNGSTPTGPANTPTGPKDNGVIWFQNTGNGSVIQNCFFNNFQGKAFRVWALGQVDVKNCIVLNTSRYSAMEIQGLYSTGAFNVDVFNCTFGNFPMQPANIPTGGVTLYNLKANQTYSWKNVTTFNTSAGSFDNESLNGVPTDQTGSKYYPTMAAAGYANDAAVRLPDGTPWMGGRPNLPPVASAGGSYGLTLPANTIILDGSSSFDPDGSIVAYNWVKTSGPSTYILSGANLAKPTLTGLIAGVYTFTLTVTDNQGATASAVATITVNPAPDIPRAKTVTTTVTVTDSSGKVLSSQVYIQTLP